MLLLFPWLLVAGLLMWAGVVSYRLKRARTDQVQAVVEVTRTNVTLTRISQAVESASDAIGIGSMDGQSLYHNRAHVELFGYTVPELNAQAGNGLLFADPAVGAAVHAYLRSGRSWVGETDIMTKSGRRVPALVRTNLIFDEELRPVGIFGVFTDMTERRRVAATLDAERQRLAITLQSIADGVIATDDRGQIELMNRVAEELTGWKQAEARGAPLGRILPMLDESRRTLIDPGTVPSNHPFDPQLSGVLHTHDGHERIIAGKITLLSGAAGMVIVFRDVTTERELANERERANRLESLGLLAGGIAHDFSNLLTAIMGNLSLAQIVDGLPPAAVASLDQAARASLRARDLTMQLLSFAKGGMPVKKPIALAGIIRESVMLAIQGAPEITAKFVIPVDLWLVLADAGQIGQVVNNLALNAVQAMGSRGHLIISAQNISQENTTASPFPVVRLTVADNGPGIPPEHLGKIFDPFFTTKAKGTGLGLATVYSIVQKHGGQTKVESVVGQGTSFHIYLPARPSEDVSVAPPVSEFGVPPSGGPKIISGNPQGTPNPP